ncbi:MAG: 50S ribosomal protein L25 [Patescibacteria group bacterium]|nr:50S ribosomal protein L25 [Patescibacteria group bacterium]MDD5490322.1 50S ribosomal protein L25 [Patescibacteria group bacterium]
MKSYLLAAEVRNAGKSYKIREKGKIPVVIYGKGIESRNLTVDYPLFNKIYKEAGESSLIDLKIGDAEPIKTLIQDVQFDPVKNTILHADFRQINMKEKITASIPLKFVGVAPAIKDFQGVFVTNLHELEVECLPGDLIHEIEVDISPLKTFDEIIRVKDLVVPSSLTIKNGLEDVVALVAPPREEEKEVAPVEEMKEPELVGKEKKEGEAGEAVEAPSKETGKEAPAAKK